MTAVVFKGQVYAKNTFDLWLVTVLLLKIMSIKDFERTEVCVIFLRACILPFTSSERVDSNIHLN